MKTLALLTFAALGMLDAASAHAQFSAVPAVVRVSAVEAGASAVVEVRNEGAEQMQFRVYLGDYDQDENGDFDFGDFGTEESSCAGRLTAYPDNAVLLPGEVQPIQLRLEPGATCWGILFVESATPGTGQVLVAQRIGVRVVNAPTTVPPEGEIASATVTPRADSLEVEIAFDNLGLIPVELRGRIEIRDMQGNVVRTAGVGPLGVLPSRTRRFRLLVDGRLPGGRYLAVPILDFGADYLAGGQAVFEVPQER